MTRLTITPHRPLRRVLVTVGLMLLSAAVTFVGLRHAEPLFEAVRPATDPGVLDEVTLERDALVAENAALRERIAMNEKASEVERAAYRDVDDHLRGLQDQVLSLREEVAFYQGIVDSDETRRPGIQSLRVTPAGEGVFDFGVVLTRYAKDAKVVSGLARLEVTGESDGVSRVLDGEALGGPEAGPLRFSFKYFQRLEGRLRLPDGFVPMRVTVTVELPGHKPPGVERDFIWPEAGG